MHPQNTFKKKSIRKVFKNTLKKKSIRYILKNSFKKKSIIYIDSTLDVRIIDKLNAIKISLYKRRRILKISKQLFKTPPVLMLKECQVTTFFSRFKKRSVQKLISFIICLRRQLEKEYVY